MRRLSTRNLFRQRGIGTILALVALQSTSCGLLGGPCNEFCEFMNDCMSDEACIDFGDEDACVEACNAAEDELNDSEADLLEDCASCVGELEENDRCDTFGDDCEACVDLFTAADDFFAELEDELGGGYCYEYYYDDYIYYE